MKKLFYLFAVLLGFMAQGQNVFENANEAYRKGDYQAAISGYESILRSGKESPELYFNLGNAYYKMNKVAPSIYNYEKALILDPGNSEFRTNLKFAQKLQIDRVKEVPKVGFRKWLEAYTSALSVDGWAWFSVVCAFGFLAFFCGYYFSWATLSKRLFFLGMFVWILGILLGLFAAYFEKAALASDRPAIIFESSIGVREEPKENSNVVFNLHEGTKVQVLETLDNWQKIELADGATGWIPASTIKMLH